MAVQSINLEQQAEFLVKLARQAGKISLKYFQKKFDVEVKSDASPVTIADKETEIYLRSEIEMAYPEHGIIGEEFGNKEAKPGFPTWTLDPIDGTKSFVAGIPLYTMIISLVHENEPILGLIYQPVLNELAWGATGLGAWYQDTPARVSSTKTLAEARVLYSDGAMLHRDYPAFNTKLLEKALYTRTWGDGYGYMMVASGRADAMIDPRMNLWDVMPLKPVIEGAGGTFTTLEGRPGIGSNALASNGLIHQEILACHQA